MTSTDFQRAYTNAVGLTEAFASFFERLTSTSPNHPQHAKSLYNFKTMIYKNLTNKHMINSQEGLDTANTIGSASDEALHTDFTDRDRKSSKDLSSTPNSLTSLAEPIHHHRTRKGSKLHISSDNLLDQAYDSYIEILESKEARKKQGDDTTRSIEKHGTPGLANTTFDNELDSGSQSEFNLNIRNLSTVFDFLSLLKASDHPELNTLFLMAADYSHVRSFLGSHRSVFLTLAFVFFERLLVQDQSANTLHPFINDVLEREIEKSPTLIDTSYRSFVAVLKECLETKNSEKSVLLFDSLCLSADIYEASLTFFKEIALQIVRKSGSSRGVQDQQFEWLNEVSASDELFFQTYARILRIQLISIILSREKVTRKNFNFDPKRHVEINSVSPKKARANTEVTFFHDQRRHSSYIIYKNRDIRRTPNLEAQLQRHQMNMGPGLNFMKSPRGLMLAVNNEKRVGPVQPEVSKFDLTALMLGKNKPIKTEQPRSLKKLPMEDEDDDEEEEVALEEEVSQKKEEIKLTVPLISEEFKPKMRDPTPTVHREDPYLARVASPTFGKVNLTFLDPIEGGMDNRNKKYKQLSLDFTPTLDKAASQPVPPQVDEKFIQEIKLLTQPSAPEHKEHNVKNVSPIESLHQALDALFSKSPKGGQVEPIKNEQAPGISIQKDIDTILKSPITTTESGGVVHSDFEAVVKSPLLPSYSAEQPIYETSPIIALQREVDALLKSPLLNPVTSVFNEISPGSSFQKDVHPVHKSPVVSTQTEQHTSHYSPILELINQADRILKSPLIPHNYEASPNPTYPKDYVTSITKEFSSSGHYIADHKPHRISAATSDSHQDLLPDFNKYELKSSFGRSSHDSKDDAVQRAIDEALKYAKEQKFTPYQREREAFKSLPNLLKERFNTCNKEIQIHESEMSGIVARYLPGLQHEKPLPSRMIGLKSKYNQIIQKKSNKKAPLPGMKTDGKFDF